jgi:hypothetical protein
MASQTEICNNALTKLGQARIVAITDNVKAARSLNAIWAMKRDAELAAHPWTFSTRRAQLPAAVATPAFGWGYSFPLPAEYLRLVEVGENFVLYMADTTPYFQVEGDATGQNILCDETSPLNVRYIARVENTGLWSPLFCEALACRLAAELAEDLTQSARKKDSAWSDWKMAIQLARRANAIEQPPQPSIETAWVRAMRGS